MDAAPPSARVAATVRAELARQGFRQVDVAARLGISQETLSRRLRGRVALNVDELHALAGILEMDPVSLFAGDRAGVLL